ncbi:formate dehydrogenase subunit delta [Salinisphaera sp. T31B1]|uniref:formate dehydrogenase subunit delta n=1 Tax=Salinisphaera sp. T31B1 TaxID=727963 RepID=UPI0033426635
MDDDKMVRQANQIADYFKVYPQQRAEEGVEGHIRKFWEPRMKAQLLAYAAAGGEGLHPLVLAAIDSIRSSQTGEPA